MQLVRTKIAGLRHLLTGGLDFCDTICLARISLTLRLAQLIGASTASQFATMKQSRDCLPARFAAPVIECPPKRLQVDRQTYNLETSSERCADELSIAFRRRFLNRDSVRALFYCSVACKCSREVFLNINGSDIKWKDRNGATSSARVG